MVMMVGMLLNDKRKVRISTERRVPQGLQRRLASLQDRWHLHIISFRALAIAIVRVFALFPGVIVVEKEKSMLLVLDRVSVDRDTFLSTHPLFSELLLVHIQKVYLLLLSLNSQLELIVRIWILVHILHRFLFVKGGELVWKVLISLCLGGGEDVLICRGKDIALKVLSGRELLFIFHFLS
jgi:hypothetical protein